MNFKCYTLEPSLALNLVSKFLGKFQFSMLRVARKPQRESALGTSYDHFKIVIMNEIRLIKRCALDLCLVIAWNTTSIISIRASMCTDQAELSNKLISL